MLVQHPSAAANPHPKKLPFLIKLPGYQGMLWMSKYNTLQVSGWSHMKR